MKNLKYLLIALILTSLSCKKDRVCSCKVEKTGTSTTLGKADLALFPGVNIPLADTSFTRNVFEIQFIDKKIENVRKKVAKNNCISYTEPYNESVVTSVPASSFNLSVVVIDKGERHFKCELK